MASKDTDRTMSCATECSPKYKSVVFSARAPLYLRAGRVARCRADFGRCLALKNSLSRSRGRTNVRTSLATDAKSRQNRAKRPCFAGAVLHSLTFAQRSWAMTN